MGCATRCRRRKWKSFPERFEEFKAGLARGDPGAPVDSGLNGPDAEWILPPNAPGFRQVYRGRAGSLEFMDTWMEDFDWSIELERVIDAGVRTALSPCSTSVRLAFALVPADPRALTHREPQSRKGLG